MRVSFGRLELGQLQPGRWRVIAEDELKRLWPEAPNLRASAPRA